MQHDQLPATKDGELTIKKAFKAIPSTSRLNLPHHLIDLISHINLTALARQLSKTPALRQQSALR